MEIKRYQFKGAAGNYVYEVDFDRILVERDALQQRLNAVEDENDRLRQQAKSHDQDHDLSREIAEISRMPGPKEQPFCGMCHDTGCQDCY